MAMLDTTKLQKQLEAACKQLSLNLDSAQIEKLMVFLQLFNKWNKVYNLSAIRDPKKMVDYHLVDSLSIMSHIHGDTVLDVGCGGGLPGIPLAIALPHVNFTLLDSNGKKTRFVKQSQIELGLDNLSVVQSRIESFKPDYPASGQFDTVTSRAFAAMGDFYQQVLPLCHSDTHILAMKGKRPDDEMDSIPADKIVGIQTLKVPNVDGERHIIRLQK